MEILRHNGISDKPNAFNKLLNLFVCKIVDEDKNPDDELQFQCWDGLSDEKLQMTLNDLYKEGMWRFLEIRVIDHSESDVDNVLQGLGIGGDTAHKKKLMDMFSDMRLKKSPNFAFVEVQDEKTFRLNAKVVREMVELLQIYKFRYEQKHEFLGSFFEKMLNTSMTQEAGQFFTPVPIARFIISSLPLREFVQNKIDGKATDPLPTVIDYACGSGHFLTEFMSKMQTIIENADVSKASPRVRGKVNSWRGDVKFSWADEYIYGIDFDHRLVKTTKVSAFFNGDGEATIVWGNGLDSFEHSEEYKDKLKNTLPNSKKDNGQFDILISNPPYSVQAFKSMLKHGADSFELYSNLTDKGSEIECLFVERMKQLLKVGGWAGVILPSSMLSNGGIYSLAREIIFKYFKVKAIVELGSGTFMKTGTNTIILFLERRADSDHEMIKQAINKFFNDGLDVTVMGIEHAYSKFVASVYEDLAFGDYVSLVHGTPSQAMRSHELWADYIKEHGQSVYSAIISEEKAKLETYKRLIASEQEKMLYFLLTYEQNAVVVRSGQKQDEKAFLGYEFSERRGYEGIRFLPVGTKLFDENSDTLNPQKVNIYIYNAFLGKPAAEVGEAVAKHVSYGRMSGFFEYGTRKFDKRVNLSKKANFISEYPQVRIRECVTAGGGLWSGSKPPYKTVQVIRNTDFTLDGKLNPVNIKQIEVEESAFKTRKLKYGDIILEKSGGSASQAVGRVVLFDIEDGDYSFSNFTACLRVNRDDADSRYLYRVLHKFYASGGTFPLQKGGKSQLKNLDVEGYLDTKIPLPPLDVQRQIVAEFEALERETDSIQEKIDANRESLRSRFAEMFGDPLVNEKGWETKRLGVLGTLKNGMNYSQFDAGVAVYCLGVGDFQTYDKIEGVAELQHISLNKIPSDDYLLRDGDIVFVRSNGNRELVGRSVVAYPGEQLVTFSGFCIRLRLTAKTVNVDYLSFALRHSSIRGQMFSDARGANISNLNQQILSGLVVPIPPLALQTHFANFVRTTDESKKELQRALDELKAAKAAVLNKYL
jgi:type I restriction enzyme M protein